MLAKCKAMIKDMLMAIYDKINRSLFSYESFEM